MNERILAMSAPALKFVRCLSPSGLHKMAYWEWAGPRPGAPVLVCVHGLSRQGRDFDVLAARLSRHYRVVCPDVVGRGRSSWLRNPAGYGVPTYVADMVTLLARLDVEQVDWVGTSMGGLIGMGLACLPDSPIRRLVLNDVGPAIRFEAIERIRGYLGKAPRFASVAEGEAYLRSISEGFGPHTDAEWSALNAPMFVPEGAEWRLHYDPAIAVPIAAATPEIAAAGEAMLWAAWDATGCPSLLIRGAESDLLTPETAAAMTQRGPKARLVEIPGVGHAPTLLREAQIAPIEEFLLAA
jgi:pimeloyl-ACP methyl ester carboxylesterase